MQSLEQQYREQLNEWKQKTLHGDKIVGIKLCDYCEESPSEGISTGNGARVCRPCYMDHHGSILDEL